MISSKYIPSTTSTASVFQALQHRGPDSSTTYSPLPGYELGFHRLAIRDTSRAGDQPFTLTRGDRQIRWICNGEIYNYDSLKLPHQSSLTSTSDCEVIGHYYLDHGIQSLVEHLDAEYMLVLIDHNAKTGETITYTARDRYGVRPGFIGTHDGFRICIASEIKGVSSEYITVTPHRPGVWIEYRDTPTGISQIVHPYTYKTLATSNTTPHDLIEQRFLTAVEKRLISDRPLGCLLSGGLDSSLVCAAAATLSDQPIQTFTIGLSGGTDLHYARQVAKHIGSDHHEIIISIDDALQAVHETIIAIESRDTTTIRASVFQYLIGKYIREHTDIKVLLTGEGSDELTGGYLYFHNAPSDPAWHSECHRLLEDIYLYDGLRVDRAMAAHGLEVRIPFLDYDFTYGYFDIDTATRRGKGQCEKYLLRSAFANKGYLPDDVLRRRKEAFSDGVSTMQQSWYSILQDRIDALITDAELQEVQTTITHCPPQTKEQLYYRRVFVEQFGERAVPTIPYYRLPKRSGDIHEPSARVLEVYGESTIQGS